MTTKINDQQGQVSSAVVEKMRTDYTRDHLSEDDLAADPLIQFESWLAQAIASGVPEPHAMSLATTDVDGMPSSRIVLLRGFDRQGFIFYTNYDSDKGRQLAANPKACLLFFWPQLERQIRIRGLVTKAEASLAEEYFRSRPYESRVGAWASPQSRVLSSRTELEARVEEMTLRFQAEPEVPLPPFWGGYRLQPLEYEFWQGRASRLHDRFRFSRSEGAEGGWHIHRLAP